MPFHYPYIFPIFAGTTMLMVSVVLVDLLGVEKIARSHGLFNVYSGVAGLLATPFSGTIESYLTPLALKFYLKLCEFRFEWRI